MYHTHTLRNIFLSILAYLILTSCAATKVSQAVLMPANSDDMKNVKKLAVVGFSGDKNNEFSNRLEVFFSNIKVKNKFYFTVIDHATLTKTVQKANAIASTTRAATSSNISDNSTNNDNVGLNLSFNNPIEILGALLSSKQSSKETASTASGKSTFSRKDAINIARTAGADTIITGTINGPRTENTSYKEDRTNYDVCLEKSGKKCKKYGVKKISCIKQAGNVSIVMKAVDVNSGKITFSKNYTGTSENKYCEDTKYKEKTVEALSKGAVDQVIAKTRHDVAPYIAVVTIELIEKDDSGLVDNKDAKTLFDTGLKLAEDRHIFEACGKFKLASKNFKKSPALIYNLGVCAEIKNNLGEAYNLYSQAGELFQKPHKLVSSALTRVDNRRAKDQRIANQLR